MKIVSYFIMILIIIWQCYLAIGPTLVLLVFIYGPHIAYFEILFFMLVSSKKMHGDHLIL